MALIKFPAVARLAVPLAKSVTEVGQSLKAGVDEATWAPKVDARPRGLAALQDLDLGFSLNDMSDMRIVLTDAAKPATVEKVGIEANRLLKLIAELDGSAPGADTSQLETEMRKVAKGLSSRLAGQKGVFLSKNNASVDLVAPQFARDASAEEQAAAKTAKKGPRVATASAVGVDPITGERIVLQPMGRVVEDLPLARFAELHGERSARVESAKILATDKLAVESLRTLTDAELDAHNLRAPDGPIEHVTLTGGENADQTYTYPTRWYKKPNDLFARRMIIEGPFRGSYLDDVATHIDEASLAQVSKESRLLWLSPSKSNLQPVVSTVQVREGGELKTKLRVRLPSTTEWTAVRQSMSQLAGKLPDVKQIEGSKSTMFVFDPTNYSFMRKVAPAFTGTKEAQQVVDAHVNGLLKFEKALTPEALEKFSAKNIGGFRETTIDQEGKVRPFELSSIQRSTLARLELDGWRGAVTLGTGMGKTLVGISALELMAKQGEKRPFLIVVPDGLEGNFPSEIYSKRQPAEAQRLVDQLKVMTYTEFRRAVRKDPEFTADKFGAVVYDEVHTATDRRTASGAAILKFGHPHTIEMTGTPQPEPERLQTMDAGVRGLDLNTPEAKADRRKARKWRDLLFTEVNGITTGVKSAFELRRGLKIDPTREMLEWIRSRFIYADSLKDDVALPKRTDVSLTMPMSPEAEALYRKTAKPVKVALEGLVSIYRDKGLAASTEPGARPKLTPQARDARVNEVRKSLKPTIDALSALTNTEEKLTQVGKTLLAKMYEDEVGGLPASRALLFTDDAKFVEASAKAMSLRIPTKLHAAALGTKIEIYQNGEKLKSIGPYKLPFREEAYRPDPTQPANATTNREVPADQWRTFVLNEVLGKHPEVATTTLFGPTYQTGQNLQWASTVVHLDRDTWSDFNMRQREARSLRRGQMRPVTVIHADAVFAKPESGLDRTLDQVRELQAKNDRGLLQQTLVAAQDIKLGEGLKPARATQAFDVNSAPPAENDLGSFMLGASPSPANVGLSRAMP